jgi:hypothetical protein
MVAAAAAFFESLFRSDTRRPRDSEAGGAVAIRTRGTNALDLQSAAPRTTDLNQQLFLWSWG